MDTNDIHMVTAAPRPPALLDLPDLPSPINGFSEGTYMYMYMYRHRCDDDTCDDDTTRIEDTIERTNNLLI